MYCIVPVSAYATQHVPFPFMQPLIYDIFDFIESAIEGGGSVLVHCSQGVSRSTAVAIAYMMWKHGTVSAALSPYPIITVSWSVYTVSWSVYTVWPAAALSRANHE